MITSWIASRGSTLDAERWAARLLDAYATLETFPDRCPVAPDAFRLGLRHIIVGEYRALFAVKGRVVFVLRIRHGRRRPATKHDLAPALKELRSQLPDSDQ
jgi:plasmid stabilization system protein ParE